MGDADLSIDMRHAGALCYAMQQCAVRWLHALTIRNASAEPLRDARLEVTLGGGFAPPWSLRLQEVPAHGELPLAVPDLLLAADAFANAIERQRVDFTATLLANDGAVLATTTAPIDVLAYNEWPGLGELPALLAAFVLPNHPALAPLLQDVAARLLAATGRASLDGYQSRDAARVRAMVAAVHEAITAAGITYVTAPPSFEKRGQKVRTPEQVLHERLGTCLDLALLYAAVLEHLGLHALVVLTEGHATVGCWLGDGSTPQVEVGPAVELRKRIELEALLVLETTLACAGNAQPFAAAVASATQKLAGGFALAIDVAAARTIGIRPLPVRTQAFAAGGAGLATAPVPTAAEPLPDDGDAVPSEAPAPKRPSPPKDRLEHWKQKLLDLSMFNRLLNFADTKKTVRLCAHDLEALDDRLQQGGRVRVLGRPDLGQRGEQPRDLALASERAGVDVAAEHLASELKAGRLRADLDAEELDERLVEIFRHARSSLEESGANTLYLAIGFLQYFETPEAKKPRQAPLLLLPLVVERTSVTEGVRLSLDDAEPRLNQTLLQFLQRDFGLHVDLGDAPPEDEAGVDVAAVLDAFRRAALAMPRWEVLPTAAIGFFSFTKYLMWLDLADRDGLLQSPVLRHLVEQPGASYAQDAPEIARDELDDVDPAELFLPKDADSSQQAAVLAAAGGRSFVLEGPPGTGKSQTITNLIAQCLAQGQRVLFVAEKRAALEVVQKRLAEVGLGAFCLELHSQKSGAKSVLEQLRRALDSGQRREPAAWQQCAQQLQQARGRLNELVRALHRRREHGASVFAVMAELVALREAAVVVLPELRVRDAAPVAAAQTAVVTLAAAAAPLGVPSRAPWWGVQRSDWTPALDRQVLPAAERLATAVQALASALQPVQAMLALDAAFAAGPSRAQLQALLELVALLNTPSLPPAAFFAADWTPLATELQQAIALGTQRDALWAPLAPRWRRELLALDLDRLQAASARAAASFFLLRWWRFRAPKAELAGVAVGAVGGAAAVANDLAAAVRVRAEERTLLARAAAAAALGAAWRGGLADWAQIAAWIDTAKAVRAVLLRLSPGTLAPDAACLRAIAQHVEALAAGGSPLAPRFAALRAAHDALAASERDVRELLQLDAQLAFGADDAAGLLASMQRRIAAWRQAPAALREHCAYHEAAAAARTVALSPLVDAHARGEVVTAALVPTFRRTFLQGWLDAIHAEEPALARFRGVEHERAIAQFAELDRQAIALSAEVVQARLAAQVPQLRDTQVQSSELGILQRELKKQKKHKPVRRLLAEIPGLFGKLAPCVLMSPLSVAQFLARGTQRFDLVVFDEASQIPMWDAVGAIGRGRSLVVVGDSRQLPPTTFFQRQAQDQPPDDSEIPEDLESVLDECGAAGLPRQFLDWHYRSRHESLIAFSNHHYYENRLLTFPAPAARAAGLGVRCVRVAGVYDRAGAQTNRVEADALLAEVKARLLDPARAHHSLGIVTFSQAQQVLVENLLDQARREAPALDAAIAAAKERLFVKNLENVQGDERDVILFSICYGPDSQGRVFENYGPLNLQGGERRLNVAVTRARRELVVFTSVGPEQVANRTASLGSKHLRTFLDYALRGTAALAAAVTNDPGSGTESPFEAAVCAALRQRGHEVHTQVGCSGYRIDLAVVDPAAAGRYLLGIECDGASYHSAATARDRDRLRASVLRGLGWELHRVWSTDFWLDPAGELARVDASIAAAKVRAAMPPPVVEARKIEAVAPPVATPAPEAAPAPAVVLAADDPDGARPYVVKELAAAGTPEQFQSAAGLRVVRDQATVLLLAEGPLVFDRLARTIAASFDLSRLTDRVRERVRAALPADVVVDGDVVWRDAAQRDAFRGFRVPRDGEDASRTAEELPAVEVGNAMRWLLQQHQALAADDLAREAARCFGITRLGAVVKDVMAQALAALVAAGGAVRDGDFVRLA